MFHCKIIKSLNNLKLKVRTKLYWGNTNTIVIPIYRVLLCPVIIYLNENVISVDAIEAAITTQCTLSCHLLLVVFHLFMVYIVHAHSVQLRAESQSPHDSLYMLQALPSIVDDTRKVT